MLTQPDLADRVDILRTTLEAYPLSTARGSDADRRFTELVNRLGIDRVFAYLRGRGIAHAALAAYSGHAQVSDADGLFGVFSRVSQVVSALHRRELARIAQAFHDDELPLIAFKGVAMCAALGRGDAPSYSNDLDILVAGRDLARARRTMHRLGYGGELRIRDGRARPMASRILEATENSVYSFGQLSPLDRLTPIPELEKLGTRVLTAFPALFCYADGQLHMKLSVDLHYSLNHLSDDIGTRVKPSEEVWLEEAETVRIEGVEVATLGPRALSWVLPHRLYVDTTLLRDTSLKALCHLKLLWHHGRFDSEYVRDIAQRYPYLAPSLYYALRAMDQLCGTRALPQLDPERMRASRALLMNVGDCLPAMLGCGVEVTLGASGCGRTDESGVTTRLV
ncbi:nucleotidyltransferase family protein [Streptomyces sp. NPDC002928]|uniref:nucleotidyltransferase family protein n=1 Tax=Streptomyces sp. NPDC002928 TaxID=3154440 RepID=UPI0033A86D6E